MYRLLIVDDEEIITDALYEVFSQSMQEELDICKAFSAKEALNWLSRSRIDIVLTDIRMPGMSGLELMEEIHTYWPRCRVIFLTGYSEFEYAYQAIQKNKVKYLLKTEGYDKVIHTVQEVIDEINYDHHINNLVKQSEEHKASLLHASQEDYFRHYLLDSYDSEQSIVEQFERMNIQLNATEPTAVVLAHLSYPFEVDYSVISKSVASVRYIWDSYMSDSIRSLSVVDKFGDLLWFIQAAPHAEEKFNSHMIRYVEGMLELIQQVCSESLGIVVSFTISSAPCSWSEVGNQYERLRQLQKMKMSKGLPLIQIDYPEQSTSSSSYSEGVRIIPKVEFIGAHLEAGRAHDFFTGFTELEAYMLNDNDNVHRSVEAYYAIALLLLSYINRNQLYEQIGDFNKLMRLDEHSSLKEGFQYMRSIAERLFALKLMDERDRASLTIDKICKYIHDHLSEDLSLVRLAEVHYFNPSYLSRFFKQERGVKLSEYIEECRLKRAKELLSIPDLKIRDVALQVGYEAAHSFTRFFKKSTGMTPQEFRDSLIKE